MRDRVPVFTPLNSWVSLIQTKITFSFSEFLVETLNGLYIKLKLLN